MYVIVMPNGSALHWFDPALIQGQSLCKMRLQQDLFNTLIPGKAADQLTGDDGIETMISLCPLWPVVVDETVGGGSATGFWTIIFSRQGFLGNAISNGGRSFVAEFPGGGIAVNEGDVQLSTVIVRQMWQQWKSFAKGSEGQFQ